jgi:anti-anti-sigma regulatory factor
VAYSLLFDESARILLVRFAGAVVRQELERLRRDTRRFVERHGNCDSIVDFTAVDHVDLDGAYLRALGGRPRVMAGARRVFVASQPEVFGIVRMFGLQQSLVTDNEPMVMRTLDEACVFLGLEAPRFAPITL